MSASSQLVCVIDLNCVVHNEINKKLEQQREEFDLADKIAEVDGKLTKGEQQRPARPSTPRASASPQLVCAINLSPHDRSTR